MHRDHTRYFPSAHERGLNTPGIGCSCRPRPYLDTAPAGRVAIPEHPCRSPAPGGRGRRIRRHSGAYGSLRSTVKHPAPSIGAVRTTPEPQDRAHARHPCSLALPPRRCPRRRGTHTGPSPAPPRQTPARTPTSPPPLYTSRAALFVKVVPLKHPQARTQEREATIAPHLPASCPHLLWHVQAGGWDRASSPARMPTPGMRPPGLEAPTYWQPGAASALASTARRASRWGGRPLADAA
jgi:hypothetical protein